ncbi:trace amine associated receptor 13e, partial [Silurus meridionalis]
ILVFAMTITILGNSVVIISIAHFKQLHTPTNILVMSLALVDLLLGITVMPFSMIRSVDGCWYYGEGLCFLHSSFDMCLSGASIFHLISIAIDRYQAVCYPLQYPTRVTLPVAWLMVAVSWTAATVYSYSLLLTKANIDIEMTNCLGSCSLILNAVWAMLNIVIGFFLPCCVMVCLYETYFEEYCFPDSNSSCSKASYHVTIKTVLYFILVFAMTITILGNSVVIISIAHFKQLHTPTNILVMSLALVDLLLGITVMPFSMIRSVDGCWYYSEEFCFLHSSFDMCLTGASIFHLISIAIDRYQAVCYPLQYPTRVTIPVAWFMVAVSWTASVVYSYTLLYSKANVEKLDDYIASISCLGYCGLLFNALCAALDACICFFLPCFVISAMYFLTVTAILMTVFGNLLVIITISHFKQLHSPTNFIILSLAFVDFMLGSLIMPFSMVRWVDGCWFMGDLFCQIHSSLDMTLSVASILHLCLVSIDRYMAITDPLAYRMKVTNGNAAVCIAAVWIFSCTFSFGTVFSKINTAGLDEQMLKTC